MPTGCVLALIKLQVGLSVKGMTFITWYKKTALNFTKQNSKILVEAGFCKKSCTE